MKVKYETLTQCSFNFTHHLIIRNCFTRLIVHNDLRLLVDFLLQKKKIFKGEHKTVEHCLQYP